MSSARLGRQLLSEYPGVQYEELAVEIAVSIYNGRADAERLILDISIDGPAVADAGTTGYGQHTCNVQSLVKKHR